MNLIEQLGGHERAKAFLNAASYTMDELIMMQRSGVRPQHVEKALLEYRRQHNIFEVGDKVVHPKFSNMNIYEICEIKGDLFTVFYNRKSHSFKSDVRHATDAEIKAGKRLDVTK